MFFVIMVSRASAADSLYLGKDFSCCIRFNWLDFSVVFNDISVTAANIPNVYSLFVFLFILPLFHTTCFLSNWLPPHIVYLSLLVIERAL